VININKDLPKSVNRVILKVENIHEYQIQMNEEIIDIKNLYLTSEANPLAVFPSEDLLIVVNSQYLKTNNEYVNMVISDILKRVNFRHIVIENIRFINEKIINQLLKSSLEIVEFKNMTITRPMITRLRFLESLKIIIGLDIEDQAYQELLEQDIEALTIKKTEFNTQTFKKLNLTKSSATFMNKIVIDKELDEMELIDLGIFLNLNYKLKEISIKCPLNLYFIKDLIGLIQQTPHKSLTLIIDNCDEAIKASDVLMQLNDAFGEQNRIMINISDTNIELADYSSYVEKLSILKEANIGKNLTILEKIFKVYENVIKLNIEQEDIRVLLYAESLMYHGITNISVLENGLVLLYVKDEAYLFDGVLISNINLSNQISPVFVASPELYHGNDNPIIKFLNAETHREMIKYIDETGYEDIMYLTNHFYKILHDDYNFKYLYNNIKDLQIIHDTLEQIYVQNRTVEFDRKVFYNIFCNVRKKENVANNEIIQEIRTIISNS